MSSFKEAFILLLASASASALILTVSASASALVIAVCFSVSALSNCCCATCFSSIAFINASEKSKLKILTRGVLLCQTKLIILTSVTKSPILFNFSLSPETRPSEIKARLVTLSSAVYCAVIAFKTSFTAGTTKTFS